MTIIESLKQNSFKERKEKKKPLENGGNIGVITLTCKNCGKVFLEWKTNADTLELIGEIERNIIQRICNSDKIENVRDVKLDLMPCEKKHEIIQEEIENISQQSRFSFYFTENNSLIENKNSKGRKKRKQEEKDAFALLNESFDKEREKNRIN